MLFVLVLSLAAGAEISPSKRFLTNCPQYNFMCTCPKYENGCYTCPSSCNSQGSSLFGQFHPGQFSGIATSVSSNASSTNSTNVIRTLGASKTDSNQSYNATNQNVVCTPLDSNCPQFMIKTDANDCPYCSGSGGPQSHNMDPAHSNSYCPPKDPSIPWSQCHIDRQGCILCEGQLVTTQSTTKTQPTTSLTPSTTILQTSPTATSGVALWSAWYSGPCSVTCGHGNQTQIRRCSTGSDVDCTGSPFRTVPCDIQNCPGYWLPYRNVTACSVTCGDGFIQQRRQCSTGKTSDCQGRDYNEVPCNVRDC